MKSLVILGLLVSSVNAFAASKFEKEVLEQLIVNSKDITLVDAETGEKLEQQLPELLTEALLQNYASGTGNVVLSATTIECKNVTPEGLLGSSQYTCQVVLADGDFKVNQNGLVGPDAESALVFAVDVTKVVRPGIKPKITSKKVKVFRAG